MVRPSEILGAVRSLLQTRFPETGEGAATYYTNLAPVDFKRPSFLVATGTRTMGDAGYCTVDVTQEVEITAFVPVDKYHNSHFEELEERAMAVQALFAVEGLRVGTGEGGRVLRVEGNQAESGYDYAEVVITLHYLDDRPTDGRSWPPMGEVDVALREQS